MQVPQVTQGSTGPTQNSSENLWPSDFINLSNRQLTEIPEFQNPRLTSLYISFNQLTSLRGCPWNLTILNIGYNQLTSLEGLENLKSLRKLYVNSNQLTSLDGLPHYLEKLHCYHNQLTSLSGLNGRIDELDCSCNLISDLQGLGNLSVGKLNVGVNPLTSLAGLENLKTLEQLDCSSCQFLTSLKGLPTGLTTLYCSDNKLILTLEGCPPSVTNLDCSKMFLRSLRGCPDDLEYLNCSFNQLSSLDYLKRVKNLNCNSNELESLQTDNAGLLGLEIMYCSMNKLTSLKGLPSTVQELECHSGRIGSLIGCPSMVRKINCHDNLLNSLIGCPAGCTDLVAYGNPLDQSWLIQSPEALKLKLGKANFHHGILKINLIFDSWRLQLARKYAKILMDKWLIPNEEGISRYSKWASKVSARDLESRTIGHKNHKA